MADKNYEAIVKIYDDTKSYLGKTDEETYNNYQKAINMQEDYIKQLELNEAGYSQDFIDSEKKRAEENLKNLKEEQLKYKSTAMVTAQNFITAFKEKQAESTQVGKNFMQGVADGISSKSSSVYSLVNSVGYKMLSGLKNALKEASPSKATREMGQFLIEGLSKGIKDDERIEVGLTVTTSFGINEMKIITGNRYKWIPDTDKYIFTKIEDGSLVVGIAEYDGRWNIYDN